MAFCTFERALGHPKTGGFALIVGLATSKAAEL